MVMLSDDWNDYLIRMRSIQGKSKVMLSDLCVSNLVFVLFIALQVLNDAMQGSNFD